MANFSFPEWGLNLQSHDYQSCVLPLDNRAKLGSSVLLTKFGNLKHILALLTYVVTCLDLRKSSQKIEMEQGHPVTLYFSNVINNR